MVCPLSVKVSRWWNRCLDLIPESCHLSAVLFAVLQCVIAVFSILFFEWAASLKRTMVILKNRHPVTVFIRETVTLVPNILPLKRNILLQPLPPQFRAAYFSARMTALPVNFSMLPRLTFMPVPCICPYRFISLQGVRTLFWLCRGPNDCCSDCCNIRKWVFFIAFTA